MYTSYDYIAIIGGPLTMVYAIALLLFPPKFGSVFCGVRTTWTLKSQATWEEGQKMFAVLIFIIGLGLFILGILRLDNSISSSGMLGLLILSSFVSKAIIHSILAKRYPSA
jgi:uncharacterized membrane protein